MAGEADGTDDERLLHPPTMPMGASISPSAATQARRGEVSRLGGVFFVITESISSNESRPGLSGTNTPHNPPARVLHRGRRLLRQSVSMSPTIETTVQAIRHTLHVEEGGDGPPALLLHSHGMSGRQWRRLERTLRERHLRTIVPDLLGQGQSSPWPDERPFDFRHEVEALGPLLVSPNTPVHLVGHSYGGFIALLLALAHPASVATLSLYDPVAFGVLDPSREAAARADLDNLRFDPSPAARPAWLRGFVDYWNGEGSWERLRPETRDEFVRVGRVIHDGAESLTADRTPASAYAAIAAPTLLLSGATTPHGPRRVAELLAAAMPHATLRVIDGAGHMGPLTHADLVATAIAQHITAHR